MKNEFLIRGSETAITLKRSDGARIETIIDTVDLERANAFSMTWYPHWHADSNSYYVYGNSSILDSPERKRTIYTLHRWILSPPKGFEINHIDHDTLNNKRSNLRLFPIIHKGQNKRNSSRNRSGYRGVSWDNDRKQWRAMLRVHNKTHFLGRFDKIEDASRAYEAARARLMPFSNEALKKE